MLPLLELSISNLHCLASSRKSNGFFIMIVLDTCLDYEVERASDFFMSSIVSWVILERCVSWTNFYYIVNLFIINLYTHLNTWELVQINQPLYYV